MQKDKTTIGSQEKHVCDSMQIYHRFIDLKNRHIYIYIYIYIYIFMHVYIYYILNS